MRRFRLENYSFDVESEWDIDAINFSINSPVPNFTPAFNVPQPGPLNSEINGTPGDDILTGTASEDVINGFAGNDIIMGLEARDELIGGDGDDELHGNEGDDELVGGNGEDDLFGGDGFDNLRGGAGADLLDGGESIDFASYTLSDSAVVINLTTGVHTGGHAQGDQLISIENIEGSEFNDTIIGDANNNFLAGFVGDDTIEGGDGNDFLAGSSGDDFLDGGDGIDEARYTGDSTDYTITNNGDGTFTISHNNGGFQGTDTLINVEQARFFDTTIQLNSSGGPLNGTPGDDVLLGTAEAETINGFGGNDTINGLGGADVLDGGDGDDIFIITVAGEGSILGGDGHDTVIINSNDGTFFISDGGNPSQVNHTLGQAFFSFSSSQSYTLQNVERVEVLNLLGDLTILGIEGTSSDDILDVSNETPTSRVTVLAGMGNDTIVAGNTTNHSLFGGDGNDVIIGGDRNDRIYGGAGADTISGGLGSDILDYFNSSAAVNVNLATGSASGGHATGDTFSGIEGLDGSELFGDILTGDSSNNNIFGQGGDDVIDGGEGNDFIHGGSGIDNAVYSGARANYTVTVNMNGLYTVTDNVGTDGQDTLENIEFLEFSDGIIDIETAAQGSPSDPINGTTGNDNPLNGTAGDDIINGLAGNDIINGLEGDDVINGDDGADLLNGGLGADVLNGGLGFDSADYRGATTGVAFNVVTGGTGGEATGDTFSGIERYFLSNFNDTVTGSDDNEFFFGEDGNDTINGGGGIDRIDGGAGNDILRGQEGNDLLFGSAGGDQLNGGTGFDIASYENSTAAVTVSLLTGGTGGDAAGDTYFGIEVVRGSDFDDSLTGNNSVNELRGGEGDDMLFGLGGNDRLFGGEGADSFDGGTGIDIVNYTVATTAVTLDLDTGGTGGEAAGDSFTSIEWVFGSVFNDDIMGDGGNNRLEGRDGDDILDGASGNDRLLGGDGNDTIFGGDGVDTIFGQDGDDTLFGGAGNDFFFGGSGADSHDGGSGIDTVSYLASTSGVVIDLQAGGISGDAEGDTYTNIERVFGTSFDDYIFGSNDDDILLGNGGADYLEGGTGNDTLIGGAGIDEYGYSVTQGGADVIFGFFVANEVIYFTENGGGEVGPLSFEELIGSFASNVGANTVIDMGGGNTLTLIGVNIADLSESNFDFGGFPPVPPLDVVDDFVEEFTDSQSPFEALGEYEGIWDLA